MLIQTSTDQSRIRRKFTTKKHKTWDGDGVLAVSGGYGRLQDVSGRDLGKSVCRDALLPGSTLSIGGKDVEIDSIITKKDFLSGIPFLKASTSKAATISRTPSLDVNAKVRAQTILLSSSPAPQADVSKGVTVAPKNFYSAPPRTMAHFKNPLLSTTVMPAKQGGRPTPRHDPTAPGALVMRRPKEVPRGKEIVDVVLDPFLGQHLREHQREGVKFMYECVMGMRPYDGSGCLLADEMGLGKTLQTIALLWTLLKQNPVGGADGVIKKALIVCPVTLIVNWKKEFRKWLGNERIGVFVADGQNIRLTDFTHGRSYSVMIIGYEKLRSVQDELKKGGGIDIVVADEGHRLKTAQNKSAQAIRNLNTPRRVILSGTPIQNDLSEFFVMVDFVNPGLLGTYNTFKKEFESPIVKSRQPGASAKEIEKGTARGEELSRLTKLFILRRTAEILSKYLPPKTEYVLFCKPTASQAEIYHHVLQSPIFGKVVGSPEASLQLITILKKVCNSPTLLSRSLKDAQPSNTNVADLLANIPYSLLRSDRLVASSKMRVLDGMLKQLSTNTQEKIVLVSNYTSTLDLLATHLASLGLPYLRIDGKTPNAKRQDLVDTFNRTSSANYFAFLLSAKSGGAGINLIGASRLVLFDVDWNPSTDLQAMARIHRDGQKRPVKIYRFLMAGGMDEKIYQRQVTKMGLADSVVDGKKSEASFSAEELRDLFRLEQQAKCQTHDLLGCGCNGIGVVASHPSSTPVKPTNTDDGEKDVDAGEDSDSADELPEYPSLIRASQLNVAAQEAAILQIAKNKRMAQSKGKMQALMQYAHLDTSMFEGEKEDVFGHATEKIILARKLLDDDVLAAVLEENGCKIGYVFAKKG